MLALGFILILIAAVVFFGAVGAGANDQANVNLAGVMHLTTNTMVVFLVGALTLLVFMTGLSLVRSGTRRARDRRREVKELRRQSQAPQ